MREAHVLPVATNNYYYYLESPLKHLGLELLAHLSLASGIPLPSGTEDVAVPANNSLIIAQKIPGAWLVQIKEAGHGLMYQYPEQLSTVLQTFLTTTAQASNATSTGTATTAGANSTTTSSNNAAAAPTVNSTST